MKVLIINANRSKHPVVVMPLGACLVAEAAERAGHETELLDLTFERAPLAATARAVQRMGADVVGLSVRNIDNNNDPGSALFVDEVAALAKTVRAAGAGRIALGGGGVSIMPEEFLRRTGADVAVFRNSEYVFPELLSAFSDGSHHGVPGTAWIENGVLHRNPVHSPDVFAACPYPDLDRWLDTGAYRVHLATVPLQTKRGCPFKCIYCTCPLHEGADYRLRASRSVSGIAAELAARGARDIEFVDNVFNSPYQHAMAVCEDLARAKVPARFHTVELNPKYVDDRLLDAMERAGFVGAGVTPESVDDTVLERLGKQYTSDDVYRAAEAIGRHAMPCFWIFMLGGPGETKATVTKTLEFAAKHVRPSDVAFFNVGVRIYPGTELEKLARREGSLTVSGEEMFKPVTYVSPELDLAWLNETLGRALRAHRNFGTSEYIALRSLPSLFRLGYGLGLRPPVWKHNRFYRGTVGFVRDLFY